MSKKLLCLLLLCLTGSIFAGEGRGYLGISVGAVHDSEHSGEPDHGVFVVSVQPGSGAERAGLRPHDKILSINGVQVQSHEELTDALESYKPADEVAVTVKRGGEEKTYGVVLGESPRNLHFGPKGNRKWGFVLDQERPWLGIEMQTLNPQLAKYFKVDQGILVEEVVEDSPAARAGIKAGDVILAWNGEPVSEGKSLVHSLRQAKTGDVADLLIVREGTEMNLPVTIEMREGLSWDHGNIEMLHSHLQELGDLDMVIPDFNNFKFEFNGEELHNEMKRLKEELHQLKQRLKEEHKEDKGKMH